MDVVDLHFVEDIDGVAVGGVLCRLDNNVKPGRVGAVFFVEEDGTDGSLVNGFSCSGVCTFVIVDVVVLAEKEGNGAGCPGGCGGAVGGEVERHDGRPGQFGAINEEGDQEEAEVYHRGEVDAGGEFLDLGTPRVLRAVAGVEISPMVDGFGMRCGGRGIPY